MSTVVWDPWNPTIFADPYPTFARLRAEAPLFRNDEHDFFALSRFDDVERALKDPENFSSAKGNILELIQAGIELPPGTVIMEDPPSHTEHRKLMSRVFTPRKVLDLEPQIRKLCAEYLDAQVGSGGFDVIADFGADMPTRVIGALFGIPEEDQGDLRGRTNKNLQTEAGEKMQNLGKDIVKEQFGRYLDIRAEHPTDDLITELMNATFVDHAGETRSLTRQELMTYISVIVGAGNETTSRLIGWMTKMLADHPDQRAELAADPSLIPAAIEEVLRLEAPGLGVARHVVNDVEFHGQTIPAGSAVVLLVASANRDDTRWVDPDAFDIHREQLAHVTFGYGIHFCLGASLARIQGRIALEEMLKRFPEWDVKEANLSQTSTVRGFETLLISV